MREHVDFVRAGEIPPEAISDGPLAGASRRLLSHDPETEEWTAVVELPGGFTADVAADGGSLELLVVDGEILFGGTRLGPLGWARAGSVEALGPIGSQAGAEVLWMTGDANEQAPRIVDTQALPWSSGSHGGPPGIAAKVLAESEPVSLVVANVPRYDSGPEFHECPEELFVLDGDVTGKAGTMTAGSYFWRPEYITHGPYRSEAGLLCFLRGHGDLHAHWIENEKSTVDENKAYAAALRRGTANPTREGMTNGS
jgi:ChrR-like protein with cupin domain